MARSRCAQAEEDARIVVELRRRSRWVWVNSKDAIVRGLANALDAEGLDVWYDEFELRIGSSLRRSIDQSLANSRFDVSSSRRHSSTAAGLTTSSTAS